MNGLVNPVDFDHVSWLQMQGSEPTDSVWCLSALCFSFGESFTQNSEANYERVKHFFNCSSYKMHGLRMPRHQGTEGGQLRNNLNLNTEFFLENSTLKFCCDQLA